jgi:hypothetical protein
MLQRGLKAEYSRLREARFSVINHHNRGKLAL